MLARRIAAFGLFDALLWVSGAAAIAALVWRRDRWPSFVAGGWLAAALLGLSAGGYFRGHYLIPALPPLAVAVALAVAASRRWVGSALLAALLVAWVAGRPWLFGMTIEQQLIRRYHSLRFAVSLDLGDYLREAGCRSLFVLASEPQIYHYSGCRAVSPMVLMNPLFGGYPDSRRRQEQTLAEIRRDPPDFIVLSRAGRGVPLFASSDRWLYERIRELTRDEYRLVGVTASDRRGVHDPQRVDWADRFDLQIFRRIASAD